MVFMKGYENGMKILSDILAICIFGIFTTSFKVASGSLQNI